MFTIQDQLREEARDYQELAAMDWLAMQRAWGWGYTNTLYLNRRQARCAYLYRIARTALLELIGADPEG